MQMPVMRKIAFLLSLLMIFMIPWENSVIIAGVGRISRIMGLGVGVFWLGSVLISGRFRRLRPFHLLCLVAFFWYGITILWSVDPDSTMRRIMTYVQLLVMIWLIWDLYLRRKYVIYALQVYVLGAWVSVIDTISNYLNGIFRGSTPRYAASGFNANDLAMVLVLGLPLAWYLAVSITADDGKKQNFLKIINYIYIPVAVFAILLTGSRTALFSMAPAFWFILGSFARLKLASRILAVLGLVAAFYIIQPLVPQASIDRLSTAESELTEGGNLSGRRDIWERGLDEFQEHPLLGTGSGSFRRAVSYKGKTAHNVYLTLLVETGLVGFLLFGAVIIVAVYHVRYLSKWETALWLTIIAIWLIGNYTLSWELKKQTWLFFSLIVVHANARSRIQGESRSEQPEIMSARSSLSPFSSSSKGINL